jgi:putative heme-binding domain-containing protein
MLLEVLVYLQSPKAVNAVNLMLEAPTQEEQLDYAKSLRLLKAGWTPETRKQYFEWFIRAGGYKGGNSFRGFLTMIKADAVATLTPEEKTALQPILDAKPATTAVFTPTPRAFVKKWTMEELAPLLEQKLPAGGRNFDRGRKLFGAANCFACHRFDLEGGSAGPDLTGVAGRFSQRDLLESILNPGKEVSDQYAAIEIDTLDGKKIVGRIVNLHGDVLHVNTDMLNPNGIANVKRNDIDTMKPSKLSMMPTGLLDTLKEDEILDLMAYLLSRGDRKAALFTKP